MVEGDIANPATQKVRVPSSPSVWNLSTHRLAKVIHSKSAFLRVKAFSLSPRERYHILTVVVVPGKQWHGKSLSIAEMEPAKQDKIYYR